MILPEGFLMHAVYEFLYSFASLCDLAFCDHSLTSFSGISSTYWSSHHNNEESLCFLSRAILSSLFMSLVISTFIFRHLWKHLLIFSYGRFFFEKMLPWLSGMSTPPANNQRCILGVAMELQLVLVGGRVQSDSQVGHPRSPLSSVAGSICLHWLVCS